MNERVFYGPFNALIGMLGQQPLIDELKDDIPFRHTLYDSGCKGRFCDQQH